MKFAKEIIQKHKEGIGYLFWGVMSTIVSWGTYSMFILFLDFGERTTTIANVVSWACAVIFAFFTNKMWVFNSKSWKPAVVVQEFWKFLAARIFTGILELLGVPLLIHLGMDYALAGIDGLFAKALVTVVVVILNYVFSKLLIFRDAKRAEQHS